MKIIMTAMALAFALPAAAQTQSAPAEHQGHAGMDHAAHAQHQQGRSQDGQSDGHKEHAMKDGCCADRNGNGRMDCCEGAEGDRPGCCKEQPGKRATQPQSHQDH